MKAQTIALTGASGFIGSIVLRRLRREGWRVRALHRTAQPPRTLADAGAEWVRGSLADGESLGRLTAGAAAVVHCAGAVRGASQEAFDRVNAEGVARLVHSARRVHPPPRFLLVSSLAARRPELSDYAASKRRGEERLRQEAGGEMAWAVFRPPAVYGPGDRAMRPLFLWMRRSLAPILGPEGARFSLIHAEDLAAAIAAMLARPEWRPEVFELDDGRAGGYAWPEVLAIASEVLGRPIRGVRVPQGVLKAAAAVNLALARFLGYAPMLTPGKVRELTHPDWVADSAALIRACGWKPSIGLAEGLARTLGAAAGAEFDRRGSHAR